MCSQLCPLPFQHHCMVPTYGCAVSALAIHPATNNLVIAYADQQVGAVPAAAPGRILSPRSARRAAGGAACWHRGVMLGGRGAAPVPSPAPQLFEFSIPEKQYTAWSRTVQNGGLHKAWLERDTPITHIAFNPQNPAHILLHDVYMFCVLDKSLVSGAGGCRRVLGGGCSCRWSKGRARGGTGEGLGTLSACGTGGPGFAPGARPSPQECGQLMRLCPRSPCPMPAPRCSTRAP